MKHITKMWEIEDGKKYFLLKVHKGGQVRTGIVKAKVEYHTTGSIVTHANIMFTLIDGDVDPGPTDVHFIAEMDE